jgi:hypothetical protein
MKAKTGRCEGRKPYGYYEGEVAILERMRTLRQTDTGFDRIADVLNAEGLKPRTGAVGAHSRSDQCATRGRLGLGSP